MIASKYLKNTTTHDNKEISKVFKILHALGNLEMISKTRCSPVMRRQCLMLNLAKTQRFFEDKRKQAAQSRLHTLFLSLYPFMFIWTSSFAKTKDTIFVVRTITKYSFQAFRDCLQYNMHLPYNRFSLTFSLALKHLAHLTFPQFPFLDRFPFLNHSSCWVCLSV